MPLLQDFIRRFAPAPRRSTPLTRLLFGESEEERRRREEEEKLKKERPNGIVSNLIRALDIRKPLETTPEQRKKLAKPPTYLGENVSRGIGRFLRTGAEKGTEPIISKFRPSVQPLLRGARQTALGFIPGPIPLQEEAIGRKLTQEEKLQSLLPIGGMKGGISIAKDLKGLAAKAVKSKGVAEFLEGIGEKGAKQIKESFGGNPKQFFKEAVKSPAEMIRPKSLKINQLMDIEGDPIG